ncbi:MAG: DoxX family membrane protein [Opitutales bacterium]|nr:DoxX family membrane protein [Opitutales bacterium]
MKIAVIIVRTLLGLLFLFASVAYFFDLVTPPEPEGALREFNEGLAAAGYLLPLVKTVELLCALAFLSGRFAPLAAVVLFPVSLNIFLVHLFLDPAGLPVAAFVLGGNAFLGFACRAHYRGLWSANTRLS